MLKKNHVGRPSNLELRNRKIKKILMYTVPILVVVIGIIILSSGSLNKLMGNSVTTYYCEDSTYTLNGTKCTKLIKEKAHLLGDISGEKKITTQDLTMISQHVQSLAEFDEFQQVAMDINEDGNIDDQDIQILKNYIHKTSLSENAGSYEIGTKLVCPSDYKLDGEYCTKTITVDANKKVEEVKDTYTISFTSFESVTGKMENQKITSGEKLNKNEFVSSKKLYFSGWRVRTTKDWKYYCYKNGNKTEKGYTDVESCEKYGYVKLEDEQVMDDEILKDNLTLIAQWDKEVSAEITDVKAVTSNIQNGKEQEIKNIEGYLPNYTKVSFKIDFNTHGSLNDYYYKISNTYPSAENSNDCKKISSKSITEISNYKQDGRFMYRLSTSADFYSSYDNFIKPSYIGIDVKIYSDSLCKNLISSTQSNKYKLQKFYIKYDLNGGKFFEKKGAYIYNNIVDGLEVHLYNTKTSLEKLFYVDNTFNSSNKLYYLSIYKDGYDIEGFRVKNTEGQYACYKNSNKTSLGYTNESDCKKYGYVMYSPYSVISRTSDIPEETLTFEAQWSKNKFNIEYLTYAIKGTGSYQKLISDSNFKNTQTVTKGKKEKLNKVNIDSSSPFGGWKIKSRESDKYYCYTNNTQTKKDYVDISICNQYGYLYLSNGAEIPDEILTRGIVLEPVDYRQTVTVETFKIEKATVTNPSNGQKTIDKNANNKEVFPANTKLDFYAKVMYDTSKTYYYKVRKYGYSNKTIDSCQKVPKDGIIRDSLTIMPPSDYKDNYRGGYSNKDSWYQLGISVYTNSSCSGYTSIGKYSPYYKIQTFDIKYDSNGGNPYYYSKVTKVYNHINPLDVSYSSVGDKIDYKAKSTSLHKKGYELLGFRVKNSKGKYICYNKNKVSQGYVDESECKKYGYVIYRATDRLARTSSVNGETLTFIAQWIKNPVTINVGKLGKTTLTKGTKVTTSISFNVNDKENVYYYKWGYFKKATSNNTQVRQQYPNASAFLRDYDPYNKILSSQNTYVSFWHAFGKSGTSCRKITKNTKYSETLAIDSYINAGLVMVYRDSDCTKSLDNEKDIRKFTEIYFCNNCNN